MPLINWFRKRSLRKAATQGHAVAQTQLGLMYYNGDGVERDYAEALDWFRKAAEQGHARAQRMLGLRYASGEGVKQDYAEALNWYRKAAAQGDANAQKMVDKMSGSVRRVGDSKRHH